MKRIAPIIFALALLSAVLLLSRRSEAPTGPEDCVRAMLSAAGDGRDTDYLNCFCEPLRSSLAHSARAMGESAFREYLKRSTSAILGIAISDVVERGQDQVTLRCEMVFKDYNETQRFLLKKIKGQWLIADMTPAERIRPPVPYGTKVFE